MRDIKIAKIVVHPVTPVLFKTTSTVFRERGLIFKGLANLFLMARAYSARGSGGANP